MQSFDVCQARTLGVRAGPDAYLRLLTQFSDLCLESGDFRVGFDRGLGEVAELVVPGGGCLFQRMNLDTSDVEVFGSAGCLAGVSDLGERNQMLSDALAGEVCLAAGPFCSFPCSGETVSAIMGDGGSMDVIGFGAEVFALVGIAGRVDVLLVVYGPWAEPTAESAEFLWMLLATLKMLADREAAAQQAKDLFFRVQRAKQEWEAIVDALPQLVCVLGGDGKVLRANRTLEAWGLGQLTGVRGADFLGILWQLGIFRTDLIEKSADWARGGVPELGCLPDCLIDDALWSRLKMSLSTARLTLVGLEAKGGRYYDLIIGDGTWITDVSALSDCSVAVLVDVTERNAAKHFEESYREILKDQVARKTRQLRLANRRLRMEMDEHERSRDAMRLLERRYQLLADNTLAGVFLVEQGHIAYHNRRFASLLGYAEGGLIGRSFAEAFESKCDSLPHPEQGFANQKLGYECQFSCRDGRKIWLHVTQAPYPDGVTRYRQRCGHLRAEGIRAEAARVKQACGTVVEADSGGAGAGTESYCPRAS